jgi:hypothetical protein
MLGTARAIDDEKNLGVPELVFEIMEVELSDPIFIPQELGIPSQRNLAYNTEP